MAVGKIYSKGKNDPRRPPGPAWKWDDEKKKWWSHGFDIQLDDGQRRRESGFFTQRDAEAAVAVIRKAEKDKKYGFVPKSARPRLSKLVEVRLPDIMNPRECARAERVLNDFISLLPPNFGVDELTTAHIRLYVDKRFKDGVKAQTVDRELNVIAATIHAAPTYFPLLAQWIAPKMPRPKVPKTRRERIVSQAELKKLLDYLLAPKRDEEQEQAWRARRRVGLQFQFIFISGVRPIERDHIKKAHIEWDNRRLKIVGTKTEYVANPTRYVPITPTMEAILREFSEQSDTEYVFTRSGNMIPNYYRILKQACAACGIPYGRDVEGGLVTYDGRHNATTALLEAGISPATVQSQMGWSDRAMVLYYGHATPASRAQAAEALENYAGRPPKEQSEHEEEFRRRVREELGDEVDQATLDNLVSSFMREFG